MLSPTEKNRIRGLEKHRNTAICGVSEEVFLRRFTRPKEMRK
jgi:hypothetical protein